MQRYDYLQEMQNKANYDSSKSTLVMLNFY